MMSATNTSRLYPPFAVATDTDHTAWIIIAAALGMSFVLLFGVIKTYTWYTISPKLGLDEVFLLGSTVRLMGEPAIST